MWTLVGGGVKTINQSMKPMEQVMPKEVTWIRSAAAEFCPKDNTVVTSDGKKVSQASMN